MEIIVPKEEQKKEVPRAERDYRSQSSRYNAGTSMKQSPRECWGAFRNFAIVERRLKDGSAISLEHEAKKNGAPVVIVGSGPSLDWHIDRLKDFDGDIVCSTSQAVTLVAHGKPPKYIVALDPECDWNEIKDVDWTIYPDTVLVLHPGVRHSLALNWPNKLILYRLKISDEYNTLNKYINFGYSDMQYINAGLAADTYEPWIKTEIVQFSCALPTQLFIAQFLGYRNTYLLGTDFGYPGEQYRFTPSVWENDAWAQKPTGKIEITDRHIKGENGIWSDELQLFYKKNFLSAVRLAKPIIFNLGGGTISELPMVEIEDFIKTQGHAGAPLPQEELIRRCERYLARLGCYVLEAPEGLQFVESDNPLEELPRYMLTHIARYCCRDCNIVVGVKHRFPDEDFQDVARAEAWLKREIAALVPEDIAAGFGSVVEALKNKASEEMANIKAADFSRILEIEKQAKNAGRECPKCKKTMTNSVNYDILGNMKRLFAYLDKGKAIEDAIGGNK